MSRGFRLSILFSFVFGALIAAGCAGRRPPVEPSESRAVPDESFDMLSLGLEELPLPSGEKPGQAADTTRAAGSAETQTAGEQGEELVPGYRVQVCATPDEATARTYYHEALMKFMDQGVYLRFDSPYYKVRIGDCKSRYEAEELQKRVQKSGFPDAWVVRTRVYANPEAHRAKEREEETPQQPQQ